MSLSTHYDSPYLKALCISNDGRGRGATLAWVLACGRYGMDTRPCGVHPGNALIAVDARLLEWADLLFFADSACEEDVAAHFDISHKKAVRLALTHFGHCRSPASVTQVEHQLEAAIPLAEWELPKFTCVRCGAVHERPGVAEHDNAAIVNEPARPPANEAQPDRGAERLPDWCLGGRPCTPRDTLRLLDRLTYLPEAAFRRIHHLADASIRAHRGYCLMLDREGADFRADNDNEAVCARLWFILDACEREGFPTAYNAEEVYLRMATDAARAVRRG